MEEKKKTKTKKMPPKVLIDLDWGVTEELDVESGKYYVCKSGAKYRKSNPHILKVRTAKAVKTEAE